MAKRKHHETVVLGAELPLVEAMCHATQELEQAEAAVDDEPDKLFGKMCGSKRPIAPLLTSTNLTSTMPVHAPAATT